MENKFVICFPCALKIKWAPQKQPGEGERSLFINTRNTVRDMAALADVGVDFVQGFLSGWSNAWFTQGSHASISIMTEQKAKQRNEVKPAT